MVDSFPLMVPGAKTDQESMVWAPFDGAEIANVAISGGDVVDRALDTVDRLYRNRDGWLSAEKVSKCWRKPPRSWASASSISP